jgi:hypothetical protein
MRRIVCEIFQIVRTLCLFPVNSNQVPCGKARLRVGAGCRISALAIHGAAIQIRGAS